MRISILTSGRFHVCDLARELDALGHEVKFYSCVPKFITRRFGLPDRCNRSLLPYVAPLFFLMRKTQNTRFQPLFEKLFIRALDAVASCLVGRCDVFIGMSGMSTRTAKAVRRKYGAQIWIERGSRHILSQKEILDALPGSHRVSRFAVQRELADYELADTIVVPSRHVERSFLERGCPKEKLFRNPYGVDLKMFLPTPKPQNRLLTLIYAGTWSLRKGCDILAKAVEGQPWRVIHVGTNGDATVPNLANFEPRGFVPQWKLPEVYGEADVFVLASREEGLSVVQAQALACGLPLVCTDRTGGEDLAEFLDDPSWVTVVPSDDATALRAGIGQALAKARNQTGLRDILGADRENLSWRAYGWRYSEELKTRVPVSDN
jgi:glycosyltransferase involved in cell wall biosynthesis